ncbi:hypothetical protein RchiOBHm_Chr4g0400901 [Rosa chinensis]|uniref:Uncharacterized protein n=1 Tax=Rosa chinensis TaxID=74649 RepID=A0A2P6QT02_ROSCH|nr:hypothetical protein RchiOBHm_Chr4g0400901 [Rosa chinensis]
MPSNKTIGHSDDTFNTFFSETGAASMSHAPSLSTSSPPSSKRSAPEPTASSSTLSS